MRMPYRLATVALAGTMAVAVALTAAWSQRQADGVSVRFSTSYYPVAGRTWDELRRSLLAGRRVVRRTSQPAEGVTDYTIDLGPAAMVASGRCVPEAVTLDITLTVTLPRAIRPSTLPDGDRACWAAYERTLTDHEEGHVRLALDDGHALLRTLRAMPGASCGDLRSALARRAVQMQDAQDAYDTRTRSGLEQWRRYGPDSDERSDLARHYRDRCPLADR